MESEVPMMDSLPPPVIMAKLKFQAQNSSDFPKFPVKNVKIERREIWKEISSLFPSENQKNRQHTPFSTDLKENCTKI